jgi:hypothetical protein
VAGSHFAKHASWGLADKPRSAPLPRDAAQLIGLHNAADLMVIRNGHMKTPIAISPHNRAGDKANGQLSKACGEPPAPPPLQSGVALQVRHP